MFLNKNKNGELILLQDDGNRSKNHHSSKYYFQGVPAGSVRAKNENEEAFVTFTENSNKDHKKIKLSSNKKKPTPYKVENYHYTGDSRDNKREDYKQGQSEKHKRSKSQTINSIKNRKGNSTQENSIEEMSHLLQKHFQNNNKTSYHLVNEYLENPNKMRNITVTGQKQQNRSRGKRGHNNVANSGIVSKGKRTNPTSGNLLKKIAFKSFDKRRAGTNLDRREGR